MVLNQLKVYCEACNDVLIMYNHAKNTEVKSWLCFLRNNRNRLIRLRGLFSMVYFLSCVVLWARLHIVHQRNKGNKKTAFLCQEETKTKLLNKLCNLSVWAICQRSDSITIHMIITWESGIIKHQIKLKLKLNL